MDLLLAIDDLDSSAFTIDQVASRPWPEGTRVEVLSVVKEIVPPLPAPMDDSAALAIGAMQTQNRLLDVASAMVSEVSERLKRSGLSARPVVRTGDAAAEILDEAARSKADLIIVGDSGRSRFERRLLGSTAQTVVSRAPCSVEVIRRKAS
jgi:nucleotide-binding universal stress UspA family protein